MEKIKTGVYGLNPLLDNGINKNSVTTIVGATGTGKTTFVTQFLHRGLEEEEEAIYITLEEQKDQILKEAAEMGWADLKDYLEDGQLVFIEAGGMEFSDFIKEELPEFVAEWAGIHARIAIDPLTPIVWTAQDKYKQRELISTLFNETKKVGTVIATLEEHGTFGDLSGPETIIPMYLSDAVIHLRYISHPTTSTIERLDGLGIAKVDTRMRIVKSRSSWHSTISHPYSIFKGIGIVIEGVDVGIESKKFPDDLREKLIEKFEKLPKDYADKLKSMIEDLTTQDIGTMNPHQLISLILNEYDITLG
ncbi:MAG: ATPase [Thermoplasmata archaeon]|nr:MAG: ATPase [Thermoplasmata archaeon]